MSTGKEIYINWDNGCYKLKILPHYAYFTVAECVRVAPEYITGSQGMMVSTGINRKEPKYVTFLFDMVSPIPQELTKRLVRSIIKDNRELYDEFRSDDFADASLLRYIRRYYEFYE